MKEITKEAAFAEHNERYRKTYYDDGIGGQEAVGLQIKEDYRTFSCYMDSSIKIFEIQTGLELDRESQYQGCWRIVDEKEIVKIKTWMKDQGTLVFLGDCLSLSVALSVYFNKSREQTEVAKLYNKGKKEDKSSILQLADRVEKQIRSLPCYKEADLICSVPAPPDKGFDLSSRVASIVGEKIDRPAITGGFVFGEQKSSYDGSFDDKWKIWEDAQVSFLNNEEFNVKGKKVILIDDLYLSGTTMQYVAMKLQHAGASEVYGLNFVKTMKDRNAS